MIGTRDDPEHDEEPGKVIHELRVGEVARLRLSPLARYYGTVDATPLFLCLLCEHADWSGDLALFRELRGEVDAMLGWIDGPGDRDGDGLLEYRQRTPDRPAQPGLEGLRRGRARRARRAARAADHAGRAAGLRLPREAAARAPVRARRRRGAGGRAARARRPSCASGSSASGCPTAATTRWAGASDARPSGALASNQGHLLWGLAVTPERATAIRDSLMSDAMFSGWGIRTLAEGEAGYNPVGYHLGTVWPHDTAMIAFGLRKYGFDEDFTPSSRRCWRRRRTPRPTGCPSSTRASAGRSSRRRCPTPSPASRRRGRPARSPTSSPAGSGSCRTRSSSGCGSAARRCRTGSRGSRSATCGSPAPPSTCCSSARGSATRSRSPTRGSRATWRSCSRSPGRGRRRAGAGRLGAAVPALLERPARADRPRLHAVGHRRPAGAPRRRRPRRAPARARARRAPRARRCGPARPPRRGPAARSPPQPEPAVEGPDAAAVVGVRAEGRMRRRERAQPVRGEHVGPRPAARPRPRPRPASSAPAHSSQPSWEPAPATGVPSASSAMTSGAPGREPGAERGRARRPVAAGVERGERVERGDGDRLGVGVGERRRGRRAVGRTMPAPCG